MQAPSRRKRVMQPQKVMGDRPATRGGGHGSRFEVLNVTNVESELVVDNVVNKLRDVVINLGPSLSAKGKMVGVQGVGSSKGADLGRKIHSRSV
ncbi:hypothetical protein V6N13_092969 [Hibiscus sabdariffa]